MRATIETHDHSNNLPPIQVMVSLGGEDMSIKVGVFSAFRASACHILLPPVTLTHFHIAVQQLLAGNRNVGVSACVCLSKHERKTLLRSAGFTSLQTTLISHRRSMAECSELVM